MKIVFDGADLHGYYLKAIQRAALAKNGMRKLRVALARKGKLPERCQFLVGSHCSLPEIMFCNQLHELRQSLKDPLTRATATWASDLHGSRENDHFWFTLFCFGKLRQAAAVDRIIVIIMIWQCPKAYAWELFEEGAASVGA